MNKKFDKIRESGRVLFDRRNIVDEYFAAARTALANLEEAVKEEDDALHKHLSNLERAAGVD
jgi:hypothetical protein